MSLEGICWMCKDVMLVATVDLTGRQRPLCPNCLKKVERVANIVMKKHGKGGKKKEFVFPKAE